MRDLFKNKKVVVMGLGLHGGGVGTAKFFCQQKAKVLVTDLKTKEQLKESIRKLRSLPVKYVLGRHRKEDFINADLIVKNPDVSGNSVYLKAARKNRVPIETDISLFFKLSRADIIGVTGTKGKSTVATLAFLLLKRKFPKTLLAGNIGTSPLEILSKGGRGAKVILELSSFALEDLERSPSIAVITNIFPDHLNRYKNMNDYIKAKKAIFQHQKKKDILVLNHDNLPTREFSSFAKSKVYFYSRKTRTSGCFLRDKKIFFNGEKNPVCKLDELKVYGSHNVSNVLAALSVAKLLKVSPRDIKKVLRLFKGVPSRQEFVGENKGVKYFNDTTATMPVALRESILTMAERFPNSKLVLIAGGQNKKLDYKVLAKGIKGKVGCLILLPGTASNMIKKQIGKGIKVFSAASMKGAVSKASEIAKKGDIVLLSPGAASFNLFKNEFDRGKQFIDLVR